MFRKINIFLLIFIFTNIIPFKAILQAQEVDSPSTSEKVYSLNDLYRIALKESEKINISKENLYIAERTKEKALSVLFPRFSSFGNYTHYSEEKVSSETTIQPEWKTTWGLRLVQSFTLNGKELIALGITEDTIKKNKYDLNAVKEAYLFSVASAYYDVLKAKRIVEIAEANVERLESHKKSVTLRLKLEEVPKTALYRTEAELSKSRTDLIGAKNNFTLAKRVLARITGITKDYEIREPEFKIESIHEYNLDSLKKEGLSHRAEVKSLDIEKRISDDYVKFSRSAYWPSISIEGMYLNSHQDPSSAFLAKDSLSMGFRIDVPLFDGGLRKADIKETLAKKRQVDLALKDLLKQISIEIDQAYLQLMNADSVIKSLNDQLKFANENYNAVSKLFKYGLANSIDVMDANTLLVTSEKQLSDARYSYQLSILRLKRAKGVFLNSILENKIS